VLAARARLEFQTRKADRMTKLRKTGNVAVSTADEAEAAARVMFCSAPIRLLYITFTRSRRV
jgi:hypothetical protein